MQVDKEKGKHGTGRKRRSPGRDFSDGNSGSSKVSEPGVADRLDLPEKAAAGTCHRLHRVRMASP